MRTLQGDKDAAIKMLARDFRLQILRTVRPPRVVRLMAYCFGMSNLFLVRRSANENNNLKSGTAGFWEVKSSNNSE